MLFPGLVNVGLLRTFAEVVSEVWLFAVVEVKVEVEVTVFGFSFLLVLFLAFLASSGFPGFEPTVFKPEFSDKMVCWFPVSRVNACSSFPSHWKGSVTSTAVGTSKRASKAGNQR